jgi:hypothetical protein
LGWYVDKRGYFGGVFIVVQAGVDGMALTVHDIRNGIRGGVGRFKREESYPFTKEELVAIANEVGFLVDGGAPPSKESMRAGIRWKSGIADDEESAETGSFTKAELVTVADALGVEPVEGDEPDPLV